MTLPPSLQALADPDAPPVPLPDAYWVVPGRFMAGPYPGGVGGAATVAETVELLLAAGVTFFLDLTEPGEAPDYTRYLGGRARHVRAAIVDFDVPSHREMIHILDTIDGALDRGQTVYLHCFAGLGRTGTIVGCYLVRHGLEGQQALRALRTLRQDTVFPRAASPQTPAQRDMILHWRE